MAGMPVSPLSVVVMHCAGVSNHVAAARLTGISWPPWPPPQSGARTGMGEIGRGRLISVTNFCIRTFWGSRHPGCPSRNLKGTSEARRRLRL